MSKTEPEQITIPLIRHHLADLIQEEQKHLLTSNKILSFVSEHFDIDVEEITGKSQNRECVLPRQVAMYLCRQKLKMSYTKIGDLS